MIVFCVFHQIFDIEVRLFPRYHQIQLVVIEHLEPRLAYNTGESFAEQTRVLLELAVNFVVGEGHDKFEFVLAEFRI